MTDRLSQSQQHLQTLEDERTQQLTRLDAAKEDMEQERHINAQVCVPLKVCHRLLGHPFRPAYRLAYMQDLRCSDGSCGSRRFSFELSGNEV